MTPPQRASLFFNPASGTRNAEREAMLTHAREAGVELISLSRGLDVAAAVRERMTRGQRLFIAAGGDGTINQIMQPLVRSEATLGVVALGTYNHFARDLGIPLDWRSALDVALGGATQQIDCARINQRFFVNNVSIGLYPEVVARREERGRDYSRWKARLWAAFATLRKWPHVSLAVETEHHEQQIRTHVFIVSNNSYDLSRIGIEAPRNSLSGGRLTVYWLPHVPRLAFMRFVAHYLAGRVHEAPGFRSFQTSRLKVQSSRRLIDAGIDGELFTFETPLKIEIVPQSLLVKVPR